MKNILITGCSSGIGYDTAHFLHKNGYKVYATARKQDDVDRLIDEGLDAYKLDVTSQEEVDAVLEMILKKDSTLYALFNNAGFGQAGALEDISVDALREQFETNVFGLHLLTTKCIKIMRKQGYGRILQHSSVLGLISLRFRGAYNASKYAIEGLCDTLRLELMDSNIYICTINTGPVKSDFRKNAIKMFKKNVVLEGSVFKKEYKEQLLDAESSKDDMFTKTSQVVIKNILDALESTKPKPRYYNTLFTYIAGSLKRVLSTVILDKILVKV
ncbi:MAG: SDR family NAD(P)-dependent oxidoreductase [Epsilonproteobacteria bacterium]|nr:SDR family NAD(P)-dependent oxidoreductase [Campylobacterota bacterium]